MKDVKVTLTNNQYEEIVSKRDWFNNADDDGNIIKYLLESHGIIPVEDTDEDRIRGHQ